MYDDPFQKEPLTDHELLRALHRDFTRILGESAEHSSRLGNLEKFQWLLSGGLAVIAVLVVPLFVDMVQR